MSVNQAEYVEIREKYLFLPAFNYLSRLPRWGLFSQSELFSLLKLRQLVHSAYSAKYSFSARRQGQRMAWVEPMTTDNTLAFQVFRGSCHV